MAASALAGPAAGMLCVLAVGTASLTIAAVGAYKHSAHPTVRIRNNVPLYVAAVYSLLICVGFLLQMLDAQAYCQITFWTAHMSPSMLGGCSLLGPLQLVLCRAVSGPKRPSAWQTCTSAMLPVVCIIGAIGVDIALAFVSRALMPQQQCILYEEWPVYLTVLVMYVGAALLLGHLLKQLRSRDLYRLGHELHSNATLWACGGVVFLAADGMSGSIPTVQNALRTYFPACFVVSAMIMTAWYRSFIKPCVLRPRRHHSRVTPEKIHSSSCILSPEEHQSFQRIEIAWQDDSMRETISRTAAARACPELTEFLREWDHFVGLSQSVVSREMLQCLIDRSHYLRNHFVACGAPMQINLSHSTQSTVLNASLSAIQIASYALNAETTSPTEPAVVADLSTAAAGFVPAFLPVQKECVSMLHSIMFAEYAATSSFHTMGSSSLLSLPETSVSDEYAV